MTDRNFSQRVPKSHRQLLAGLNEGQTGNFGANRGEISNEIPHPKKR